MSSYFDFFCKNIEKYGSRNTEQIRGTCNSMCPQDEVQLREKERLVHVLEVVGSERRLVKSYSRSAADSNMAVPHHLRPYSILQNTVHYLIFEVCKRTDVPLSVVYDFVNDRLRAVRQDITIQRLPSVECTQLLEPMVRFYVYFGYRLHGLALKDYDPILNKKYTLECIKWFLSCCDNLDTPQSYGNDQVEELGNTLDCLRVGNYKMHYDRVLVESLYILCYLDDINPLYRYIRLSKDLKTDARLQLAYKIAVANMMGNFVQISKLLKRLCSLSYCALCLHLPALQRRALQVLCCGYNNKRLTVPGAALCRWVSLASEWEARAVCQHYGFMLYERDIRFEKGNYKPEVPLHTPKIQLLHDGSPNLRMEYVFTYIL